MEKLSKYYNLAVINPDLSKQWHSIKNENLTPYEVTPNSHKKVYWICEKGHEWEAIIYSRNKGNGCPYCSNQKVCIDNCLATINPELSKEWHSTKNGDLTLFDICPNSGIKVWWMCEKGHEWEATIDKRNNGTGCPYCDGKKVCIDNCLATLNPELSKQWNPIKNGKLTPFNVTVSSGQKVWWICEKGHEWEATIASRNSGNGCPHCRSVISEIQLLIYSEIKYFFNESKLEEKINKFNVDIFIPEINLIIEYDGCFYHKNKFEKDKEKTNYLINLKYKVLRIRENGKKIKLNKINDWDINYNFEEKNELDLIKDIFKYILSNFLLNEKLKIKLNEYFNRYDFINNKYYKKILDRLPFPQYEKTLEYYCKNNNMQYLLDEWNYEKNGNLTPDKVYTYSNKKVYWKCKYNHNWITSINARTNLRSNCPLCYKNKINNNIINK